MANGIEAFYRGLAPALALLVATPTLPIHLDAAPQDPSSSNTSKFDLAGWHNPVELEHVFVKRFIAPAIQNHMPLPEYVVRRQHRDQEVDKAKELIANVSARVDEKFRAKGERAPSLIDRQSTVKKMLLTLAIAKQIGIDPRNHEALLEMCTERSGPYLQFTKSGNYLNIGPKEMERKCQFMKSQMRKVSSENYAIHDGYSFLWAAIHNPFEELFQDKLKFFFNEWGLRAEEVLAAAKTAILFQQCYESNPETSVYLGSNPIKLESEKSEVQESNTESTNSGSSPAPAPKPVLKPESPVDA